MREIENLSDSLLEIRHRERMNRQVMDYKHIGMISDWIIDAWEEAYRPLNVRQELLKMEAWLEANPRRRKKNYRRFVINWLNKSHAQVAAAYTLTKIQARAGRPTERVGCWIDGKPVED